MERVHHKNRDMNLGIVLTALVLIGGLVALIKLKGAKKEESKKASPTLEKPRKASGKDSSLEE